MGAIARAAANNITTSGVFTSGAIANSSVTGITVLANASDGITLISSQTASNTASVSFTSGITSTYKAYKFVFANIYMHSDQEVLTFNMSTDGGSNYNVTKTTTAFNSQHSEAGTDAGIGYQTGFDNAQSTGNQHLFMPTGNGADEAGSGTLTIFNPSSTTYVKHFIGTSNTYHYSNYSMSLFVAGYGNTTSAINAVRFLSTGGGNITGTIYMYGIK
jgi:hypothetical protein